jgi:N-acetylglucosaminyldiphosphoundecaprenol N-acetyl-beta-D-mannosaminyltransferase
MNNKLVLKSRVSVASYSNMLEAIMKLTTEKQSSYVCVSNVHMVIEAYMDKNFLKIMNNADITTPDGMPLAKAINLLYGLNQDRVAGMDLMPDMMKECNLQNRSIFLYGSTLEVLEKIIAKVKIEYPNLRLDSYSPPFRELSPDEEKNIVEKINSGSYDFVFVALGCPKQEKWMNEHKDKIQSCMIGLGGAFEVFAGTKDRAPQWMQDYSLEWIYRLVQDPKRLWKRYMYTNTLFVVLFIKQVVYYRFFGKDL